MNNHGYPDEHEQLRLSEELRGLFAPVLVPHALYRRLYTHKSQAVPFISIARSLVRQ